MNQIRAMIASLLHQWKITFADITSLSMYIMNLPMVIIFAWIAHRNPDPSVLTYLLIGAPLMAIWNGSVFYIGNSLRRELEGRTLDFVMTSRTPVLVVLFGDALAQILFGIPAAAISFGTMLLVTRTLPGVDNVGLLIPSLFFVILGITVNSLLFAPLMVLVGGRAGFFNPIIPFGTILSGFVFPVDRLPVALEVIARLLPTSWAMNGIRLSVQGPKSFWLVASSWLMCILMSVVVFGITYLLFKVVEKRIRVTGVLGIY